MQLREYQKQISANAVDMLNRHKMAYLSMECRTGKTITALEAARLFGARSVLFVTKIKAMQSVLDDYKQMQQEWPDIYTLKVINYESAHKLPPFAYDLAILDESHTLGAFPRPSKRTQNIKQVCKGLPILYLSGTPSPESYSQLYHQFWVSSFSPFTQRTFYTWANAGFVKVKHRKVNGYVINDYSGAKQNKVEEATKHLFLSYSQKDAGFETEIKEELITVKMQPQTANYLQQMKRDKVIAHEGCTILGDTPAKMLNKMHQLSSGTIIDEEGQHHITDPSKAIRIASEFRDQKIAIFYVYQSEADLLHKYFPNYTEDPQTFQDSGNDCVFIAQVRKAREGVRLDKADALIFYNLEYSYLSYEQGRNRIVSKERATPAPIYFVISQCGIESKILDAVHNKEDFTLSYYNRNA